MNNFNIYVLDILKGFENNNFMAKQLDSMKNQKKLKKVMKLSMAKDPTKPKRGKSGFLFFCDETRPIIKESNPDITVKEIVSRLGSMWQQLKVDGNISLYEDKSKEDRERYRAEMVDYRKKLKEIIPQKTPAVSSSVKEIKTPSEKKQTALENYIKSKKTKIKEKYPDVDDEELLQVLKNKWKKLPFKKRAKYINNQ